MMKIIQSIAISLLLSHNAFAQQDIQIQGTTAYPLKSPKQTIRAQTPTKSIQLLNIALSDKAWQMLDHPVEPAVNRSLLTNRGNVPTEAQLGMNDVPVLDQGPYGACVVFAVTAAIDATLEKGDYISQLCHLELGQYLEKNSYAPSGWNGSIGAIVLNQLSTFGFVTKETERTYGCGGLMAYPKDGKIPENNMTPEEYHQISHGLSGAGADTDAMHWSSILDVYQAFSPDTDRNQVLQSVKKALNEGDRLTFSILLFLPDYGVMGAAGQHEAENDTWVLTPIIRASIRAHGIFGGHEMVITGYDDNAVAIDKMGLKHQGLLTLRNSWGEEPGDNGDFYMSYDYFKLLVTSIERIRHF